MTLKRSLQKGKSVRDVEAGSAEEDQERKEMKNLEEENTTWMACGI